METRDQPYKFEIDTDERILDQAGKTAKICKLYPRDFATPTMLMAAATIIFWSWTIIFISQALHPALKLTGHSAYWESLPSITGSSRHF
jgi:hypothetical protein